MRLRSLMRWDGVPTFVVLSACAIGFSTAWSRKRAELVAPIVPGYSWQQHPNAVLLTYPIDDCGCVHLDDVVSAATKQGADVVVASVGSQEMLDKVKAQFSKRDLHIYVGADPKLIARFSPRHKLGMVHIVDGQIVAQAEGGMPDVSFFKKA